jgi:hypothetical protein
MTIEDLKDKLTYMLFVLENVRQGLQQSQTGLGKPSSEIRAKYAQVKPSLRR